MRSVVGAAIAIAFVIALRWFASADMREAAPPFPEPVRYFHAPPRAPLSYKNHPLRFLSCAPPDSLILLPGIGPVLAERIVGARSGKSLFSRWDDLLVVNGIGPRTIERLRALAEE